MAKNLLSLHVITLVFLLFFTSSLFAMDVEIQEEPLSLEQALTTAYLDNPEMRQSRKAIDAAKGKRFQAEALPDIEGEIAVGGLKKNENGARKGNIDYFTVAQPLEPIGTRFLKASIAKDEIKVSKKGVEFVWAEVRRQVIALYSKILAEEKAQEIARDNLNVTRQFFTRVETRFQSGSALQSDVLRARIEVLRAENELLVAQKNLKVSKGELNIVLGRGVETAVSLTDSLSYEALRFEYEMIKTQAPERRADIFIEATRLKQKEKEVGRAVLKTFLPKMSIGMERITESYENDTAIVLAGSYPLWGFNLGEVKEARAEKEKQKIRLEALRREVGLEVYRVFLEAELSDKQVLLQKKAQEESNELLRQVTLRYEGGEVPFLTYLENIKTIKETRLAYFNALKNYQATLAELEKVIQDTPVPEGVRL